jgi:hypothetical protein
MVSATTKATLEIQVALLLQDGKVGYLVKTKAGRDALLDDIAYYLGSFL